MSKARPGRRVEFRLPEDHPFFTMVPLGERQDWLAEMVTSALGLESVRVNPNPDGTILRIENKIDQILKVMADGISINSEVTTSKKEQSPPGAGEIMTEKPKPAVKNPRALVDF